MSTDSIYSNMKKRIKEEFEDVLEEIDADSIDFTIKGIDFKIKNDSDFKYALEKLVNDKKHNFVMTISTCMYILLLFFLYI